MYETLTNSSSALFYECVEYSFVNVVHIFQDLDRKEAEEERKRASQANKRTGRAATTKAAAKKPPRKNNKIVEPEAETTSNSSMEVGKSGALF